MSLKYEQYRSLHSTREFMRDLLQPDKTPRVPKAVRQRARSCLRHFPHLDRRGAPMFSGDDFECLPLD